MFSLVILSSEEAQQTLRCRAKNRAPIRIVHPDVFFTIALVPSPRSYPFGPDFSSVIKTASETLYYCYRQEGLTHSRVLPHHQGNLFSPSSTVKTLCYFIGPPKDALLIKTMFSCDQLSRVFCGQWWACNIRDNSIGTRHKCSFFS